MAIFGVNPYNFGGTQVGSFGFQSGLGIQAQSNAFSQQALGLGGPAQIIQVLQQLISSLSQLSQGWGGLLGQQQQQNPFGQFQQPYYGTQTDQSQSGVPNFLPTGAYTPTVPTTTTTTGGGLYGGGTSTGGSLPALPFPSDGNDYASYLQAQVAGGALNGQTTVNQSDGIPGTRFATVAPSQLWNANVGRLYAYQFAAQANGYDPLSAQGLQAGAQAMQQMSPDAQLFMQVASVFKGNLNGGPGNYDNAGLKQLLINAGAGDLTGTAGVGETDVQTIGAVAAAINRGQLSLQDVINSGTIDNLDRYGQIINYVQSGHFQTDLNLYDTI
ncbi:MAG: hypothetical protein KF760_24750 [Candidatus Eremiobacteraeota bacterium]|nr:hypothetical protein [Candidatus Eremiobacteraeota bacterium]MCW5871888.1 hypothetical protein [Candidatus Eremiobacteraeota bacterium]